MLTNRKFFCKIICWDVYTHDHNQRKLMANDFTKNLCVFKNKYHYRHKIPISFFFCFFFLQENQVIDNIHSFYRGKKFKEMHRSHTKKDDEPYVKHLYYLILLPKSPEYSNSKYKNKNSYAKQKWDSVL